MSVVQISRIQQRRGKKNSDFGFPQLSSGELGWAIDTQELYIGNGAVSEGAPYVGNSKILTEHDDILNFVALYEYKKGNHSLVTGPSESQPITLSLQDRLDNIVSIRSFGAIGDGLTDDTAAIQRAIFQLFLNPATINNKSSRVVLYMDAGEYLISDELKIPPFTHIVGAGIDSTHIVQTSDFTLFKMVGNDLAGGYLEFGSMYAPERPRYILISALTLENVSNTNRIVYLDNTDSTLFDRVRFLGNYYNLSGDPSTNHIAVEIRGTSDIFRSFNVLFNYCIFNNIGYGFYSETDHDNININHCTFDVLYDAINIGGGMEGAKNTNITDCYFDNIKRYGIYVKKGYGNNSSNNKFMAVGNDGASYAHPKYANILFDSDSNQSINDYFQRNTELRDHAVNPYKVFVPYIESSSIVYNNNNFHKIIYETFGNPEIALRLPLYDSGTYTIDYVINKEEKRNGSNVKILGTTAIRNGTLTINVDIVNFLSVISDNYQYNGDSTAENIEFSTELHNYTDTDTIPQTSVDTLVIKVYNPRYSGNAVMNCVYRMMTK